MSQAITNGRPKPYRLAEVLDADPGRLVYILGTEADVDFLWEQGFVATCLPPSSSLLLSDISRHLEGRHVVLMNRETDDRAFVDAEAIYRDVASVRVYNYPGCTTDPVSKWLG